MNDQILVFSAFSIAFAQIASFFMYEYRRYGSEQEYKRQMEAQAHRDAQLAKFLNVMEEMNNKSTNTDERLNKIESHLFP